MSEMVERVAKALLRHLVGGGDEVWHKLPEKARDYYRAQARAAIEVMREPTKKMLDAAQGSDGSFERSPAIRKVAELYWQNMIDAAL